MKMAKKYVIGKQLGFILMNEEMKDEHKPFACFYSKDYLLLTNLKRIKSYSFDVKFMIFGVFWSSWNQVTPRIRIGVG